MPPCTGTVTDGDTMRGQDVVGAVPRRAVGVPVAVVTWQQAFERVDEVVVGPGAGLDDRHAGGGVRDEDVAQAVAAIRAERPHRIGQVDGAARAVSTSSTSVSTHSSLRRARRIDARVYFWAARGIAFPVLTTHPWRKQ